MRRIIFDAELIPGRNVSFESGQLHYIFDVLRMEAGTLFHGIDASGQVYICRLLPRETKSCTVLEADAIDAEPTASVSLFVPLLKGDKLDWVVQKGVELGAARITFFKSQRCVATWQGKTDNKLARMKRIARDAAQQCRRNKIPTLEGVLSVKEVVANEPGLFAWEQQKSGSLRQYLAGETSMDLALATGPEGGFTEQETELFVHHRWQPVSLGPRILRAETAAITMLACTMFAMGEMG